MLNVELSIRREDDTMPILDKVKEKLAHRSNYGSMRGTNAIEYIVIHYTANDGDRSWNNANYFTTSLQPYPSSAHYFVDDNEVWRSVPDNYVAYSVGSKTVDTSKGGGKFYKKCTNFNSISIEMCDTNKNGIYDVTERTVQNTLELTRELMKKYNVPLSKVIRHFDVTGKECPKYWIKDSEWERNFKSKLITKDEWHKDNGKWWYRYADGTYPTSEWKEIDNVWYYFDKEGYLVTDKFIKADDYETSKKLYYLNLDGSWDKKTYRWKNDDKGWWIAEIGSNWYPSDEWWQVEDTWYYFNKQGYMVTGTVTIGDKTFHFDENGGLIQ